MTVDDPRARDMLRAYRQQRGMTPARGTAIWDRLEHSLDASTPSLRDEPVPSAEPWHRRPRWIAAIAIAAGAVLALALAPQIASRSELESSHTEAVHVDDAPPAPHVSAPGVPGEPAAGVAAPPATEPHETEAAPVDSHETAGDPQRPQRPRKPRSEPIATSDADDLVVEAGLIRRARRALQGGDPRGALAMLDAHAQAFPAGQMLEDRLALRIESLCAAGADPQARAEAKQLRRRFPGTAHAIDPAQPCRAR